MTALEFGKRSRLTPTRGGLEREVFFVCYLCPAELTEQEKTQHDCRKGN